MLTARPTALGWYAPMVLLQGCYLSAREEGIAGGGGLPVLG